MEINENKCTKCSLSNCKICEGSLTNNTCISCLSSYNPKLFNKKIISCELDELKEINDSIIDIVIYLMKKLKNQKKMKILLETIHKMRKKMIILTTFLNQIN